VNGSALISPDGMYRYKLLRGWGIGPRVMWIMLNPSTADASVDDRTIERCTMFSVRERGPGNRMALWQMALESSMLICAWGAHAPANALETYELPTMARGIWCLGKNKNGSPKHPLYLSGNTPLVPFP
jgi:hypothetical protein